jgi:hypothetical protein
MVTEADFISYTLKPHQIEFCTLHAQRMSDGAKTHSFKNDSLQNTEVYTTGKLGEFAIYKWLKENNFNVIHAPFRDTYQKFDKRDDFQIKTSKGIRQIEVRCKTRNFNPAINWDVCSDCIKPALDYLFVSFNRKTQQISILGWATFNIWALYGKETRKGDTNNNFRHKVNEFNLPIQHLMPMELYKQFVKEEL